MAKLIVIEGPDKVGKETQSKLLTGYLRSKGYRVALVEVPVNDNFTHKVIYWMLRNGMARTYPDMFQYVQYLNKKFFQEFKLPKLEKENDILIFDRWTLSTIVYGAADLADKNKTAELVSRLRKPDLTIVLNGPAHTDHKDDTYEKDDSIQARVRVLYRDLATIMFHNHRLINSEDTRINVHNKIVEELSILDL